MESLPLSIVGRITSCLESNAERVLLTLVCKRFFDHRESYLRLNADALPGTYAYHQHGTMLGSYRGIIDQHIVNAKMYTVRVHSTYTRFQPPDYFYFFADLDTDHSVDSINKLYQAVLAIPNIAMVQFSESKKHPFSRDCWDRMKPMLQELTERSVPLEYERLVRPEPLPDIPLTTMHILAIPRKVWWRLAPNMLPSTLTRLSISSMALEGTLDQGVLPAGLKMLSMFYSEEDDANLNINLGSLLPPHLETLCIGSSINQSIPWSPLPSSIKTLEFGSQFGRQLDGTCLPQSLTRLTMDGLPPCPINFPPSLTELKLDRLYLYSSDQTHPSQWLQCDTTMSPFSHLLELNIKRYLHHLELMWITSATFPKLQRLCMAGAVDYSGEAQVARLDLSSLPSTLRNLTIHVDRPTTFGLHGIEDLTLECAFKDAFNLVDSPLPLSLTAFFLNRYTQFSTNKYLRQSHPLEYTISNIGLSATRCQQDCDRLV
ncbi:hypothetical protein SAMD00019534_007710 [Acytostelium subglobosum LB1]|uniref:hypothetical protein n=1 Tax=Acytostelium subglobosum LB1 TaxID=1410327 RepID=UPI000644D806|nr:hypothetical protein SAMD00019534_007710 [Acytostelium subglobosum LB1]GAM17596.1 hypothetical protein SAMD00019534_007710 [Acytostelium subglobosum LB1]|eukprot:XP_012759658.1 hypothetical protein SAMD00019534_007710 [Acytostelium subglobosum LB1]